jgi:hypothetical protein
MTRTFNVLHNVCISLIVDEMLNHRFVNRIPKPSYFCDTSLRRNLMSFPPAGVGTANCNVFTWSQSGLCNNTTRYTIQYNTLQPPRLIPPPLWYCLNVEDVITIHMYLPPLEIVIEVVTHSRRNIALFHLKKESSASDRIPIPPSLLVRQLTNQYIGNVAVVTNENKSWSDPLVY